MRYLCTILSIAVLSAALAGCGGYYGYGHRNGYGYNGYNSYGSNSYGYNNNANWGQPDSYSRGNSYNAYGNYSGGRGSTCWNCGWQ